MVNNPNIRFAGFSDDWEERKLGDITQIKTGSSDLQDAVADGEYPFFVRSNIIEKSNRYIFDGEAILIPGEGRIGEIYHYINGKFDFHQRVYKISGFSESYTYGKYVLYYMQKMFKQHAMKFTVKATVDSLRLPVLSKFNITLPTLKEQQKLGSIFSTLDHKIGLEERQISLLKDLKKGYLQKMFPKNGAKVPEWRFAGFADDWEVRKLGDLSKDTIGGGTPKTSVTEFWNGEIPWIQSSDLANDKLYGVLPKKFITEDAVKNSATKLIPKNSIAIVTRVGVGKLAFMPYEFTSSQDFLSLSNLQVDCNFGMYSIYKMLQRELNNIQGTSIKGITKADLLDKEVIIPVELSEQQKIGSFFKQLDNTIAHHQRKLDLLKDLKKGLLQQMFV
jgi:type I restriction enzyme S subunit